MKRSIVGTTLCVALSFLGCQEMKEDGQQPLSEKEFYKTIGEEIPFETAMEWIEYYRLTEYNKQSQSPDQGRTEILAAQAVSASQMNALLGSTEDLVGVAFHYGLDSLGIKHVLVIPVDGSLSLWSSLPGRIFVDANTGNEIAQSTASAWAQNYKNAHPNDVWFHFFGKYIFDDMTALPYFNSVEIEQGTQVLDLTPELLLVVWNEGLNILGRTNASEATVYDASNACPPCAAR